MTEKTALTIYQIIPKVREEVGVIRKDQQATGGARYSYRGTDAIINALAPVLNRYGVFTTVEDFDVTHTSEVTATKKVQTTVTLKKRVRFYGPQGDYVESVVAGENSDYSDKATGGASTYAYRYALVQTFVLPTDEDDPDAKYVEKEAPAEVAQVATPPADDNRKEIVERIKKKSQTPTEGAKGSVLLTEIIAEGDFQGRGFNEVWKQGTVADLEHLETLLDDVLAKAGK